MADMDRQINYVRATNLDADDPKLLSRRNQALAQVIAESSATMLPVVLCGWPASKQEIIEITEFMCRCEDRASFCNALLVFKSWAEWEKFRNSF